MSEPDIEAIKARVEKVYVVGAKMGDDGTPVVTVDMFRAFDDVRILLESVEHLLSTLTDAQTEAEMQASEVERLRHELAEVSEAFELARAGSWTGWKDMGE